MDLVQIWPYNKFIPLQTYSKIYQMGCWMDLNSTKWILMGQDWEMVPIVHAPYIDK